MGKLKGNLVLAQSGGPTAVINNSACGIIQEALKHSEIEEIYGAEDGILGILQEKIFDLRQEDASTIEGLKHTPAAALGSCRYKLKSLEKNRAEFQRIIDVFAAHNIRYFLYIGGNDSMETADKVNQLACQQGYTLRVIGVPKTIDNDLEYTNHCPGFGSAAKYAATTVKETSRDAEAMSSSTKVAILETMGRNTGWLAGSTVLAKRTAEDAPHLIYLPEITFSIQQFKNDVMKVYHALGRVFIVASEGLKDQAGSYLASQGGRFAKDAFGHSQLGGVGQYLKALVEGEIGLKCRAVTLGLCQRSAMHFASLVDAEEAYLVGKEAVRYAVLGKSGYMVSLIREDRTNYRIKTGLVPLADVANGEKHVPRSWINEEGNFVNHHFIDYVIPLVQGEVKVPLLNGLPYFVRLKKVYIERKLKGSL